MEMSKLIVILTELLVFLCEFNSVKSKGKCRLMARVRNYSKQINAKKGDPVIITCSSHVDDSCPLKKITVSLYKKTDRLGQLSEVKNRVVYKYRIESGQISDSGKYTCVFQRKRSRLNTTISVNVTDFPPMYDPFLPEDGKQVKNDQLYLGRKMKNSSPEKVTELGGSCMFDCTFYSPSKYVALISYWVKHTEEMDYGSGITLTSNEKYNIMQEDSCQEETVNDTRCVYTQLNLAKIDMSDHAYYTCVSEAQNHTLQNVHMTFRLMIDATRRGIFRNEQSTEIEFNSNASVCLGQAFSFSCFVEDKNLKLYLYKVNPSTKLTGHTLYMKTSQLLAYRMGNTGDQTKNVIKFAIKSVTANHTGRYACVIHDDMQIQTNWKSMHLSLSNCGIFDGNILTITGTYVFLGISLAMASLLILCVFVIIRCKNKNDFISKYAIRKIIIIEYESPIYKSKMDLIDTGSLMPDSHPILAPVIKIQPLKRSRRRHFSQQLPSTSTDRTRLESTGLSSQLDNDVFESNQSDSSLKMKSELLRSTTSFLLTSMYEFPHDYEWEFPRERLKVTNRKLGEGAFGMVYEGLASDICDRNGVTRVGVKMMKDDFSDSSVLDFVKEIETMKQIGRHRHVIQLLGVCTQNGPLRVVVELAPYGNLRDYLRSNCLKTSKSMKYPSALSRTMLCIYSQQIARGMTYLSSRSVVHRDLSARNILVGENYDMKIADFGLTRIVDYYYRKKTDGILPIKWMAPEALLEKKYTTKSDVWSYGILLWEIFSMGDSPYGSILPENVVSFIKRGIQNPQPMMANLEIYQLMQQCWLLSSDKRPHFYQIVDSLKSILQRVGNEPEPNIYHSQTLYLEMESEYLEPKGSLP